MKITGSLFSRRSVRALPAALALAAALSGCKVMQAPPLPVARPLPGGVPAAADSLRPVFRTLFPDSQLLRLIDTALHRSNALAIAGRRIVAAEAGLARRRGALLPSVDAVLGGGAEKYGDYTMNGVGNFDTNLSPNIDKDQKIPVRPTTDLFLGFRSSWEIDLWGRLRHLRGAAQARLLAAHEGRRLLVTTLVAELAGDYYSLVGADRELAIVRRNIRLQQEALAIVEAQKAGGRANELAVQQFRAQLLHTRAIEWRVLQERQRLQIALARLGGDYPHAIGRDTSFPAMEALPAAGALPAALLYRRPDIRQAEYALQAAKEDVAAARAAFLPSLTLNPYVALNAFTPALLLKSGSAAYGLTGGLTAPLFHQRALRAQLAVAGAAADEAVYHYAQQLVDAYGEAATQLSAVENYRQAYALNRREVSELQAAVATARDLYLSGYANYLEVITAQKSVLEAELRAVEQQRDIALALVQLYRSLGGGWDNGAG